MGDEMTTLLRVNPPMTLDQIEARIDAIRKKHFDAAEGAGNRSMDVQEADEILHLVNDRARIRRAYNALMGEHWWRDDR